MNAPKHLHPAPSTILANISGAHLPPLALDISPQFQFCVDAGAVAAVDLLANISTVLIHDHVAVALRSFGVSVAAGMAANGCYDPIKMQECADAFTGGYLGRLQQQLMASVGNRVNGNQLLRTYEATQ
jgi:hypothetical protein